MHAVYYNIITDIVNITYLYLHFSHVHINYIHIGYHQKGLCKGCVLEWNIAQNLQKRKRSFKKKANLTTKVCW